MAINLVSPQSFTTSVLIADTFTPIGGSPGSLSPGLTTVNNVPVTAALEIQSTSGALLYPRMTTVQRLALVVTNGMTVYDTTLAAFFFYQNGAWVGLGGGGGGGTVTQINQGSNIVLTPNPITVSGSVALDPILTNMTSISGATLDIILNTPGQGIVSTPASTTLILTSGSGMIFDANGGSSFIDSVSSIRITNNKELVFLTSGFFTSIKSASPLTTSSTYTLPATLPVSNGQVLSSNTSGVMTWINASGAGTVTSVGTGAGLTGGPITGSGTISIADTGVSPSTYNYATITVNSRGQITAANSGASPVTQISQFTPGAGSNILLSPNPITSTGTVRLNSTLTGINSVSGPALSIDLNGTFGSFGAGILNSVGSLSFIILNANSDVILNTAVATSPGTGLVQINGDISLGGPNKIRFNSPNLSGFYTSLHGGNVGSNQNYTLPTALPAANGNVLTSTTAGIMSWDDSLSNILSIDGPNLLINFNPSPGVATISTPALGFLSLSSGANISLDPNSGAGLVDITSNVRINNNKELIFFTTGFSTSIKSAASLSANSTYTLPAAAPVSNGQILSSTTAGVMSWITGGAGTVTSISAGSNIVCAPDPITTTGTISLQSDLFGIVRVNGINGSLNLDFLTNQIKLECTASGGTLNLDSTNRISLVANGGLGEIHLHSPALLFSKPLKFVDLGAVNFVALQTVANLSGSFTYTLPSAAPVSNGESLVSTTAGIMSWVDVNSSKFILQQPNSNLPNAQSLSALATGILKSTTTTGVISIAASGTDYFAPGTPDTLTIPLLSGNAVIFMTNTGSTPATPSGGGRLFVQGGQLKYIGSSGTITVIASA